MNEACLETGQTCSEGNRDACAHENVRGKKGIDHGDGRAVVDVAVEKAIYQ